MKKKSVNNPEVIDITGAQRIYTCLTPGEIEYLKKWCSRNGQYFSFGVTSIIRDFIEMKQTIERGEGLL